MSTLPKCETCLNFLVFQTDWLGRVQWLHPEVKCIAPPPVVYQDEGDDDVPTTRKQKCVECRKMFKLKPYSSAVICGSECRKVRRKRKFDESIERCKRKQLLRRVA